MVIAVLAYIDPGSGALLLQAAIATFVGGVAYFRRTLLRIAGRFLGSGKVKHDSPES